MATLRQSQRTAGVASGPSINTPPTLDLRSIQQAFDNVRERIASLEASLASVRAVATTTAGAAQAGTAAQDLTALQAAVADLEAALEAVTDEQAIDHGARVLVQRLASRVDALEVAPVADPTARAMLAALTRRVEALELEP